MYFFLILSLPSVIFFYCFYHSEYKLTDFLFPVLIGLTIGVIFAIFKEYFVFLDRIPKASFFSNMLVMTRYVFFPNAFFFLLWEFFSKDEKYFKNVALFPLVASFYTIYNPYSVISGDNKTSFFMLFFSPILIMSMILWLQSLVFVLTEKTTTIIDKKKKECKSITIIVSSLILAIFCYPLIYSFWLFNILNPLYIFLSVIFIISSIISHKIVFRKENSLDKNL